MHVVALSGSPSAQSRSSWLLQLALARIGAAAHATTQVDVRGLSPVALLSANTREPAIAAAITSIAAADVVLVATPIYKAAYSGLLKTFLDLLPADALRGKLVLPLATGGSPAHLLALEYALKPVLGALGARHVLDSVYASDAQLTPRLSGGFSHDPDLESRIDRALAPLTLRRPPTQHALAAGNAARCSA